MSKATTTVNLLHLSDLHFGDDADALARKQRSACLNSLAGQLGKLAPEWKPNALAISGDLTAKGKPEGYAELAAWLRNELFPATGLTPDECLICPGNHYVDRKFSKKLARASSAVEADELLHPDELEPGFTRPFHAYVKFAEDFGIPKPWLHGTRSTRPAVRRCELGVVLPG